MFFTGTISLRGTKETLEQGVLALQHLGAAPIQPDPCRDNSGHKPLAGQILPTEFSPWPDFCMSAHRKGAEQGNGDTGQEYVLFGGFSAGYSCPAEGQWPKGTGMELP